jgi:predicted  nucleic acid-binding Zn-ribbon protein
MGKNLLIFSVLSTLPLSAADKVTYDDQVLPIFQQSCLNCHNPDKNKGGLDLSSFSGAMKGSSGGKIVEPGDAGSKLLACVMQTSDKKMPPEGDKLGADKISLLKAWIDGGLLENKSSSARKASKPKFDTALGANTAGKPEGPPPMPKDVLLEPAIVAARASSVHAMVASPWAPLLAITGQRQVILVNTDTLELAGILPFPEGDPISLSFTPNARYLIVGGGIPGKSGVTVTFDVVTGERMLVAGKEFDSILAADLTPDLSTVATGSPSRLVKIWKAEDGSQIRSIKKHTDWVTALDFSPDGILLATGDRGGGVWVWETSSGNEFQTLRAHQAAITAVSFRADSNLVASASEDGTVRFWEMNGGTEVKKIDAHPGGVLSFAWFHDGSFITCGRDHAVRVWKPDFNLLREFKNQPDIQVAATCDFEGKRAFAADYRGLIVAWDLATGNTAGQFDANPPSIATRVENLHHEIEQQPARLSASAANLDAARTKLDEAKKHVSDLETALNQAKEEQATFTRQSGEVSQRIEQLKAEHSQLEASRAGLPPEEAGKLDAEAATQSKEAETLASSLAAMNQTITTSGTHAKETEAAIAPAKEALPPLEKAFADATAAADSEKQRVASLEQQARHWEAAAVNAECLHAKANADRQNAEAENLVADFNALTKSVAGNEAKQAEFRKQIAEIEARSTALAQAQPQDPAAIEEARKANAAAHEALEKLEKDRGTATKELAATKEKMDQALPAAKALKDQAEQLKNRYVSLLPAKQ